jgi:hypothetical protein
VEEKSVVIRTALTRPAELGLPFACWTLDRLAAYLSEQSIGMRRSHISVSVRLWRSCPSVWCRSAGDFARSGEFGRMGQAATAGSLTMGSSLILRGGITAVMP